MSIAEKLQTIAENEQNVYNAGYEKGKAEGGDTEAAYNNGFEAGKQSEYDRFWDVFQNYGKPSNYYYAFCNNRFTDETYNPKYDIVCSTSTNSGTGMFQYTTNITDTKVSITAPEAHMNQMFGNAENLETIRKLIVFSTTSYIGSFDYCNALKNITIEGTIGQNFKISFSPLTKASIISIISALSDETTDKTVAFKKAAVNAAFETAEGAADGSTSEEWSSLLLSKSNWKISLE